jgi:hypothetical protein
MEVFMDDFSVHGRCFESCLKKLEKVLERCGEIDLVKDQMATREGGSE